MVPACHVNIKSTLDMKKLLLPLLLAIAVNAHSQDASNTDDHKIKAVINQFFDALEKKDSTLMKNATMTEGQIWRIYSDENPNRYDVRLFEDDIAKLGTLPPVKEIALDFEIKVHENIAVAWVPYEFWLKGEFSHCGIDVFTLFKVDDSWKIMSAAYSIERENCDKLKGER